MYRHLLFFVLLIPSFFVFGQKLSEQEFDKLLKNVKSFEEKGDYKSAINAYENIVSKSIESNYNKGVSEAYIEIANCYYNMSIPDKSIKFLFLAEKEAEDDSRLLARIAVLKGTLLFRANSYEEAEKKYRLAIEYAQKIEDKNIATKIIESSESNMASIDFQLQRYDSALKKYYKLYDSPDKVGKIVSSINMAEIFVLKNKLDSATKYFNYAEKNIPTIPEKEYINYFDSSLKGAKIIYNIKIGEYEKAIKALKTIQGSSVNYTVDELLGMAYGKIGERDSSIFYFQKNMNDKLNKKVSDLKTFEASTIIHNEEKLRIEENYQRQKKNLLGLTLLTILCLIALGFMFYYKQKLNKKQTQFLESEKEKLKIENDLAELKQQHIQKQVLATSIQLEQKNKFLDELKENIKNGKEFNLNVYLKEEQFIDKDLTNFNDIVKEVHPNFFKNLNEISQSKLTNLDLKYAAFIYMNMNNSQIAETLRVDPKTVSVTKYRLKQKLGLSKDAELDDFIRKL